MSPFEQVLRIAQEQAAAAARGDLDAATARLDERGRLLAAAPPPQAVDTDIIQEILRLDLALSGAIRARMADIRSQVLEGQRGQRALHSYGHAPPARSRAFNAVV